MIIFVKVVFNLVLSISKTHLIVKLETFPHLRRARAGFGWGRGAVRPPPNKLLVRFLQSEVAAKETEGVKRPREEWDP